MSFEPTHLRGDVWHADFGQHPEDPEQAFHRPALVVSDNRLHHPSLRIAIVIPGTTTIRDLPLHVVVEADETNGLIATTAFQVEQVRAVSRSRLLHRLGRLAPETRYVVDDVLKHVLSLG